MNSFDLRCEDVTYSFIDYNLVLYSKILHKVISNPCSKTEFQSAFKQHTLAVCHAYLHNCMNV